MKDKQFALTPEQLVHYKQILISIITKYLPDAAIYCFGSRVRQDSRQGSDFDILIDAGAKIDRILFSEIKNDIEESTIPVHVDILDKYELSDTFNRVIQKDLIVWKK